MSAGSATVVDTWAMLALLLQEAPADAAMRRYLRRAASGNLRLMMNLVNLGEVYYRMAQIADEDAAEEGLRRIRRLPIELLQVREPMVMEAARLKSRYRLSYADAFAVATARLEKASVVTGDPEIIELPRDVVRVVKLDRSAPRR
jgi:uncharacterized protein